jgi:hypothetical protein
VPEFVRACELSLAEKTPAGQAKADSFLRGTSWDRTWSKTALLLKQACTPTTDRAATATARPAAGLSVGA